MSCTIILALGLLCTYLHFLNIPIYWPFLMVYVLGLALYTLRKHISHMRKYGYSITDFTRKGSNK
jgi:hypothetical protein